MELLKENKFKFYTLNSKMEFLKVKQVAIQIWKKENPYLLRNTITHSL